MDALTLDPVDTVDVTILVDNVVDITLADAGPARRMDLGEMPTTPSRVAVAGLMPDLPIAEHGFSALVTLRREGIEHRLLFDAGMSPMGLRNNLRRLGIDPTSIEAIVISHGHFDHTMGLHGLLDELGPTGMPVILHPEAWSRRRLAIQGRGGVELPTPSRRALVDVGFEVVEEPKPSFVFDGMALVSGQIDREVPFETGFPGHERYVDGAWVPDPDVPDDQALIVNVRDDGLLVLSGCGHAGIVNTIRHATRITGIERVHAVMGGFHLGGRSLLPRIGPTVDALVGLNPDWVVAGHCTGWRATQQLAERLPEAYLANSVGTTFAF